MIREVGVQSLSPSTIIFAYGERAFRDGWSQREKAFQRRFIPPSDTLTSRGPDEWYDGNVVRDKMKFRTLSVTVLEL